MNKGAHQGPALTAAQKATIAKWDGGGGGDAGGTKAECQATCKANHAGSVAKWSAYNTCVTSTCGSSCL